jgi:hypothetical protein
MSDKQAEKHRRNVERVEAVRNDKRDKFYQWVASQQMQTLVNKKYRKGLYLKFE